MDAKLFCLPNPRLSAFIRRQSLLSPPRSGPGARSIFPLRVESIVLDRLLSRRLPTPRAGYPTFLLPQPETVRSPRCSKSVKSGLCDSCLATRPSWQKPNALVPEGRACGGKGKRCARRLPVPATPDQAPKAPGGFKKRAGVRVLTTGDHPPPSFVLQNTNNERGTFSFENRLLIIDTSGSRRREGGGAPPPKRNLWPGRYNAKPLFLADYLIQSLERKARRGER